MIEITFKDFFDGNYPDEHYELYAVKSPDELLYIGISRTGIWHRWFGGFGSHWYMNIYGDWFGSSPVGRAIHEALPSSWEWTVELWTLDDCLDHYHENWNAMQKVIAGIRYIENRFIVDRKPSLNRQY